MFIFLKPNSNFYFFSFFFGASFSTNNVFYGNVFRQNYEFHAQDWCLNIWNSSLNGNYWDDFYLDDQWAIESDYDDIVDEPYNISRGYQPEEYPNKDYFPLRIKPVIKVNNSNLENIFLN